MIPDGLIVLACKQGPKETADRLAAAIAAHGMTILARIDHAAAAAKAGLSLRATEVFIFGNPKAGTPLMQAAQTMGIDLPLKALVFEDEAGKTWLGYNEPEWLAMRHGATGVATPLAAMTHALEAVAQTAAQA